MSETTKEPVAGIAKQDAAIDRATETETIERDPTNARQKEWDDFEAAMQAQGHSTVSFLKDLATRHLGVRFS